MRYALFADVHGNLEALQAVLKDFKRESIDEYVCLGDIVGYGANPNECIRLIKTLTPLTLIAGNHDWASVEKADIDYFNPLAKKAIIWTQRKLTERNKNFLKNLPLVKKFANFVVVHGSLYSPEKWYYIFTMVEAGKNFSYQKKKVCFIAHSHQPFVVTQGKSGRCKMLRTVEVSCIKGYKYLINIGSVGQPRDGNPDAAYYLYDTKKNEIKLKRVPYNTQKAQDKIIAAGLPPELAFRLSLGR